MFFYAFLNNRIYRLYKYNLEKYLLITFERIDIYLMSNVFASESVNSTVIMI